MAKKTFKRGKRRFGRSSSRGKSRGGKSFAKRRPSKARGSKRSGRSNSGSRGQTIRLVLEMAPQESSLQDIGGKPTRKATF